MTRSKAKRFRKENNRLDAIAREVKANFTPTVITRAKEEIRRITLGLPAKRIPIDRKTSNKKPAVNAKKIRKIATETRIERYATKLRLNTPKSEVWFQNLYNKENISYTEYNQVLGCFIPDVINRRYRFIIEVDGNIHNSDYQKAKDRNKDGYYRKKGYNVFRVIAYDYNSYKKCIVSVKDIIKTYELARISPVLEQGGPVVNKV